MNLIKSSIKKSDSFLNNQKKPGVTVVLDNIRSAWNVGSVMRTCDALGFDLILLGYTPRPVGQTLKLIKKTAIGAENTVNWQFFETATQLLQSQLLENQQRLEKPGLKNFVNLGIEICDSSKNFYDFLEQKLEPLKSENIAILDKIYIWFGNEIHGLSLDLMTKMDENLYLPMKGSKESLNISSSMAVAGYLVDYYLRCRCH
jgi:tRNA G18 (ribose-2'-O)-methylase SpoU